MFKFFDKPIEKLFLRVLHKQRKRIINKSINAYIRENHPDPCTIDNLREKLEAEADRIYAIVDKSIVRERIKRARYTFWITAITSVIIVGVLGALTSGAVLPIIIPILVAFVTWAVTLGTIPISYNQRVQGAMDSTIITFKKSLSNHESDLESNLELNLKKNKEEINTIKHMLIKIIKKLNNTNKYKDDELLRQMEEGNLDFAKIVEGDSELNETWSSLKKSLSSISIDEHEQDDNKTESQIRLEADTQKNKEDIKAINLTLAGIANKIDEVSRKVDEMYQARHEEKISYNSNNENHNSPKQSLHHFHFWHKKSDKRKDAVEKQNEVNIIGIRIP